jgi:hypothetical protein
MVFQTLPEYGFYYRGVLEFLCQPIAMKFSLAVFFLEKLGPP